MLIKNPDMIWWWYDMTHPIFLDLYVKGHALLTSRYMRIFFAQIFFKAVCSLGIQWIDCDICLTTSNKWVQKIKNKWVQKIKGQNMNRSIKYMNGSVFSKARYMNGVGFKILARTPVPHLPPSYPPPPPPPHPHPTPESMRSFASKWYTNLG